MQSNTPKTLPIIDPEFKTQIEPLTDDEFEQLEINILEWGCREPLVVWAEHNILIDGHNRFEICTRHGIPYQIKKIELDTRQDVISWIIDNQLGRRNLTPLQQSYLRGKRYSGEKQQGRRVDLRLNSDEGQKGRSDTKADLTSDQNDQKLDIAERFASQYKVSAPTIRRDAQYAIAVNTIAATVGNEARVEILGRSVRLTKQDTIKLAEVAGKDPGLARTAFESIRNGLGRSKQVIESVFAVTTNSVREHPEDLEEYSSVKFEADNKAKQLGLSPSTKQVLPDMERRSSLAEVDDRPFAVSNLAPETWTENQEFLISSKTKSDKVEDYATSVISVPKQVLPYVQVLIDQYHQSRLDGIDLTFKPKSGWEISPQMLTTTVKGHNIAIHFEDRGHEYFFRFWGEKDTISANGFYQEYIRGRDQVTREYLNPGVWADDKAEELYANYQKSQRDSATTH